MKRTYQFTLAEMENPLYTKAFEFGYGQGYDDGRESIVIEQKVALKPDPITGLVPCGCGGEPEEGGLLFDTGDFFTSCRECGTLAWCMTQEGANKSWNQAMGWKGDVAMHTERVDVAPGFDSIRPEGKAYD